MKSIRTIRSISLGALGLLIGGTAGAQDEGNADLQRMVTDLQIRNRVLEQGIAEANRAEKEASEQLAQVRERLEALGRDLLDGGDERLIQATADIQILNERINRLEGSAMRFSGSVSDYLRTALAADPDARLRVESAMRELDEVLGLRQKPAPTARSTGSARRAKVMSIDKESGLLVLNIGEQQTARIGTTYRLYRGDQAYGTAVIADVRQSIAGAFVESREANEPVRLGDTAILETE
ncbi:hypothetical protein [Haloferula rosea]|uniref:Uncharacterized protein n=1 Tax=Haloferula rosea TaxID=490093 RepID=A0A934VCU0_9BACT|nr:hypothetical protein [Haloferula rosea]MBK1825589.1 hypothetical protein [Haloferula rosea]